MPLHSDLDALRPSLSAAADATDPTAFRGVLGPVAHALAMEDGVRFRELVTGMPQELWHDDVTITTALGTSFRSAGSPPGSAALAYLRTAERLADADPGTTPTQRVALLTAVAAGLRTQGRLADAEAKLKEAQRLLDEDDHGPAFVAHAARHALEYGVVDLMRARLDRSREHLEFAYGLGAAHLTLCERVECIGTLALAAYAQGDLAATDRLLTEGAELGIPDHVRASGFAAPLYAAEILVTTDRHRLEHVTELADAMVAAAANTEWAPLSTVVAAYAAALRREPVAALDLLGRAYQGYRRWPEPGIGQDIGRLLEADILSELDRGDESFEILAKLNPHEHHALCPERFMARLALRHGDVRGADAALADCELLGDAHSPRTLIDVRVLRAAIEFERGALSRSDLNFDRALHAMAETGVQSPLRHVPGAVLGRLAERALQRDQSAEVRRILDRVLEHTSGYDQEREALSERERLVLVYVERKLTVAQIAAELFISPNTVKTHLRRLYRKLGVTTREEAIRRARTLGLHLGTVPEITRGSPAAGDTSR